MIRYEHIDQTFDQMNKYNWKDRNHILVDCNSVCVCPVLSEILITALMKYINLIDEITMRWDSGWLQL